MKRLGSISIVDQLVAAKTMSSCTVLRDSVKLDEFKILQKEVSRMKKIERKKSWSKHKK